MAEAQMVSSIQLVAVVVLVEYPHLESVMGALEGVATLGTYEAYTDHNAVEMKKEDA